MQYKEIVQQKLREESVLKSLQQANECGKNCKYSEEQILEAQHQLGKNQINHIYNELINPASNALSYVTYILTTLVLMPILYVNNVEGTHVAAVIAYMLVLIMLVIMQVVESSVKKDAEKNREWIKYFTKFSNDTYAFGYILTSLGYLLAILDSEVFWFVYIIMIMVFSVAIFFDLVKPLVINLQLHFGNRKLVNRNK
ncbi:MAG TPA: hypothetical protein H9722_07945 [Candidatus Mediterraneibacter pullistercoris]|nr:hypothetical protein [Candidatus Mediterraneibacter pullistercoris]